MTILRDLTLTAVSKNSKTGPIPTTSRPLFTCPKGCPFRPDGPHGGCYGSFRIFGTINRCYRDITAEEAGAILGHRRPEARVLRDRVVGDIVRDGRTDLGYLEGIAEVSRDAGLVPFGYSHAWRDITAEEQTRIREAGYVLNASTETVAGAIDALEAGWPATIASDSVAGRDRIAGRRVVECPANTRGLTCGECRLCARPDRPTVVLFKLHGPAVKRARETVATLERLEP